MAPTPSATGATDARLNQLRDWLGTLPAAHGLRVDTLRPASADASFRRYFRLDGQAGTLIAMDAPPPQEDCRPFVHVAALLGGAGVHAPQVLEQDIARGFLLLTDLGPQTYLQSLRERHFDLAHADALFRPAIGTLVRWQSASREGELPPYDEALLRRELSLFPDWYVERHLQRPLDAAQREALDKVFRLLVDSALAQPRVYVHRDYMPRNLMINAADPSRPGVLDFQDAVYGPITYDAASLLRDAFLSWEEEQELDWAVRYWEAARLAGLPVDEDFGEFYRALEWMGAQRHLKVAGIFARLRYRDGKAGYVEDTPRFIAYLRRVATRYTALAPLARLLDQLEDRAAQVGYTF
ncbi:aminoglycoside phosphotransferase family protein [Ralstonia nicotianae]